MERLTYLLDRQEKQMWLIKRGIALRIKLDSMFDN